MTHGSSSGSRMARTGRPSLLISHREAYRRHSDASPAAPRLKRCNDVGCHANAVRGCHTTARCRAGAGAIVAQSTSATPTTVDGVRTTTASSLTQCGPLAPAASIQPAIRWKEHPKSRTAGSETSSVIAINSPQLPPGRRRSIRPRSSRRVNPRPSSHRSGWPGPLEASRGCSPSRSGGDDRRVGLPGARAI